MKNQDGKKDEYIIGVIGPALIENATIEEEMDGYVSWRGGVVDNGNGTYSVNYKIDHSKGVAAHNGATIDMYIKIDDGTMFSSGKYSKRRRSNVAVIIVRIVFICPFLFYCLLLNHSFQTNPNKITNCFKLFSLLQLYNYIAPASLF